MMMPAVSRILAALLMLAMTTPGCASAVRATADDGTITTRVKIALLNDTTLDAVRIDVSTTQGVVTLSGRVRSRTEEARGVSLARSVRGVVDVKSTLLVQP